MSRLLPILVGLYLLVSKKKIEKKIINILIFFVPLFSLIILTSERMALVYCTFTFLLIIFYAFKINKKIAIIFSLLVLSIPLLLYVLNFGKIRTNLKLQLDLEVENLGIYFK